MIYQFAPDALALRTVPPDGWSFQRRLLWPLSVASMVMAPEWDPDPASPHGLYGLLDGQGEWRLLGRTPGAIWMVVAVVRAECVDLGQEVKFPRCRVEYAGRAPGACALIWGRRG